MSLDYISCCPHKLKCLIFLLASCWDSLILQTACQRSVCSVMKDIYPLFVMDFDIESFVGWGWMGFEAEAL